MRGAFYYGWYPEQWSQAGHRYTSTLGEYDSGNVYVMDSHIDSMKYAKADTAIFSWWGKNTPTDERLLPFLDRCQAKGFKACIYYEIDQTGGRWKSSIRGDLLHLSAAFNHPAYYKVAGKPVVFVYCPSGPISMVDKWSQLRSEFSLYLSLTDLPNWWTNLDKVDHWHGYRPEERCRTVYLNGVVYSMCPSAGFWAAGEEKPRLTRDFAAWEAAVSALSTYNPIWELFIFNEHGEGTIIEPSDARCNEYLCADYLITLAGS